MKHAQRVFHYELHFDSEFFGSTGEPFTKKVNITARQDFKMCRLTIGFYLHLHPLPMDHPPYIL